MSSSRISVTSDSPEKLVGRRLVQEVIDPEIDRFEAWFMRPENGNSTITPMERELLRSYLYQKLMQVL